MHAWYDSLYMAAYAVVANGAKPVTGENLATTLSLLQPPGTPIRTGPEDIAKAFHLLRSGQGIDLDGTSGSMDLDANTGAPAAEYGDMDITCPWPSDKTRFRASGFSTQNGLGTGAIDRCGW